MGKQTIVIAGASSGIGAALTEAFAAEGDALFLCAQREERLASLGTGRPNVAWHICDLRQDDQIASFASWLQARVESVDALVNCTGKFGVIGPILNIDLRAWRDAIETNLIGVLAFTKAVLPLLLRAPAPRILNFAGGGAFNPVANYSAYAVSKAGLVRLTENLAQELAPHGVRVNCIAPGFLPTEIHDATLKAGREAAGTQMFDMTQQKLQEQSGSMPAVIACVRFLLSERAGTLTGKTISANFDPWSNPAFAEHISEISASDLYTMRRVNLVHLPENDPLRRSLS